MRPWSGWKGEDDEGLFHTRRRGTAPWHRHGRPVHNALDVPRLSSIADTNVATSYRRPFRVISRNFETREISRTLTLPLTQLLITE